MIVQVRAGGGTISLLGTRNPDGSVRTFPEGLNLLKDYPSHQLYPVKVHPEFRQSVFDATIELTQADGGKTGIIASGKAEKIR